MTRNIRIALIHFVCAFVIFSAFFMRLSVLWDDDSYYHLAVARWYATSGPAAPIPWARLSLLGNGADKEWLFHLLLVPFAAAPDAAIGGRIALAAINAMLATTIGFLAARAMGPIGYAIPLWLWLSAPPFFARVVRLRPELLALFIILLAVLAAARKSYRWLAVLAFAFAIGYTAVHVFLALCVLWAVLERWRERAIDWQLIGSALLGTIAGMVLRPHPIANLRVWYVQNVLFFFNMQRLDVGNEIFPPPMPRTLWQCLPWIAAMAALVVLARRSARVLDVIPTVSERPEGVGGALNEPTKSRPFPPVPRDARDDIDSDATLTFITAAAVVFDLLYFRMGRMSVYAFPLTTLALMIWIGRRVNARAIATILIVTGVAGIFVTFDREKREFLRAASTDVSELDRFAFGQRVPEGARIAASWSDAESYAFWAPQGRYLNVLDPIFMAVPFPREYDAQRRLFRGLDPDVPFTLTHTLQSEYIALDWTLAGPTLVQRLRNDPRLQTVYGGYNILLRVQPARNVRFITGWSGADEADSEFVAMKRGGCSTTTHIESVTAPATKSFEFAPWGPSRLSIDGVQRIDDRAGKLAILGSGTRLVVPLTAGPHSFVVETCDAAGTSGFYLVER